MGDSAYRLEGICPRTTKTTKSRTWISSPVTTAKEDNYLLPLQYETYIKYRCFLQHISYGRQCLQITKKLPKDDADIKKQDYISSPVKMTKEDNYFLPL